MESGSKISTEDRASRAEFEKCSKINVKSFDDGLGSRWRFWRRRRFIIVLMLFFGEFIKAVLRSNLSIAVFPMTENLTTTDENGTEIHVQEFDWDTKTRGLLLSVFFYGYTATNIPGGILAAKYGGAKLFGLGIILSSVTTFFTPAAARIHLYVLIALRIVVGMFEGSVDPSMDLLLSRWIPAEERSTSVAIVVSGTSWGITASMAASSAIGSHWGWEAIFYCTGAAGVVCYAASLFLLGEHPALDKKILLPELLYIQSSTGKTMDPERKVTFIPYLKIITSMPLWAIMVSQFAGSWSYVLFITQSPAYFKDVLKMDYQNSGYFSSLSFAIKALSVYFIFPIGDLLTTRRILTFTTARKIFMCASLAIMCISGFLIQNVTTTIFVLTNCVIMLVCNEIIYVQSLVNSQDLAPRYSSVLAGITNSIFALCGMVAPTVIGYLTQNKTVEEWYTVFTIQAVMCLLAAVIYGVFASGELQPWATERYQVVTKEDVEVLKS